MDKVFYEICVQHNKRWLQARRKREEAIANAKGDLELIKAATLTFNDDGKEIEQWYVNECKLNGFSPDR